MSFSLRVMGWLAAMLVVVALGSSTVSAQGVAEEAHAAAEHAMEDEAGGNPNPLAIDPDLAIWTLVVFVIVFGILAKFAWPQISEAIDERERKITATIAAADAKLEDAKRILAEHEAKLAATAGEVKEMLDEARRDAEVTKKRIEEDGRKAAADEVARGALEIKRATDAALQDLAVRSAKLAIELGERVVRDQLQISPEHQARIVRDALEKLSAAAPSRN
jgi:F-type H+-transporting ATPase subunit b